MTQTPKPQQQKIAPDRARLEKMLLSGPDLIDTVQQFITDFKLPYRIDLVKQTDGPYMGMDIGVLRDTLSRGEQFLNSFITEDSDTLKMKDDALKIAMASEPYEVLITGETGTGKEIIGKAMIGRRKGKIQSINCSALPEHLIESELFGHIKGSFTGADRDKEGLCTSAADGVLFLDEIGDMPMPVQAKLLRAIQEKRIRRVGATVDEEISCRFVCATLHNIKEMVDNGKFRKDLYARISTLELHIEPLLKRMCDVIPITKSIKGHEKFLADNQEALEKGLLDLSLNVRSLQRYVTRYNVLGRVKLQ